MFPISGRTDIISIIDNTHYGITTRIEKDVEKVTVYKNKTKMEKKNYTKLPSDIQQIVEKPFTTELIYFLSTYKDTTGPDPVRYTMWVLNKGFTHFNTYTTRTGHYTALMYACMRVPSVIPLLKESDPDKKHLTSDASMVTKNGSTALMFCTGSPLALNNLLRHFTNYAQYVNIQNTQGQTALLLAVIRMDAYMIRKLSNIVDIDPNRVDKTNKSVMTEFTRMMHESEEDDDSWHIYMSESDADVLDAISGISGGLQNEIVDPKKGTLLMRAICMGEPNIINNLLEWPDVKINYQDSRGYTALMLLCNSYNHDMDHDVLIDIVKKLITKFPDVDPNLFTHSTRDSALTFAARTSIDPAMINVLRTIPDMNIDHQDITGKTALMHAHMYCEKLSDGEFGTLLASFNGANPNIQDFNTQTTILLSRVRAQPYTDYYVSSSKLELLKYYFPTIDPNLRDRDGFTALAHFTNDLRSWAKDDRNSTLTQRCMDTLIHKIGCDTSIETASGETPLTFLVRNGCVTGLQILLASGKPLGRISVRDWIKGDQELMALVGPLFDYIQFQGRQPGAIREYYSNHVLEQKTLNEVEFLYR